MKSELRVPAIEVRQSPGRTIYTFAIDGKLVPSIATISRVRRTADGKLAGYQRPEVLAHIAEIRTYLETESPMIPNAIVVAFDSRVRFKARPGTVTDCARPGELIIPVDKGAPDEDRPGFVVDGQQRLAAIRDAAITSFPICVSAFITDDTRHQTEQFILVNSTKPLPKGLIYELLPSTDVMLPSLLYRRRLPAALLTRMNLDEASPLYRMIQTATNPTSVDRDSGEQRGLIKDNSVLKMLENSLSDGVLYRLRCGGGPDADTEAMLGVLYSFWRAVKVVFADAWGLKPKQSRLMHGAGVVSLGFLMDAIADRHRSRGLPSEKAFIKDLEPLKEICCWTAGHWEFGAGQLRKWNELQNTTKDIQLLSNYLLVQYKARVWNTRSSAPSAQLSLTAAHGD